MAMLGLKSQRIDRDSGDPANAMIKILESSTGMDHDRAIPDVLLNIGYGQAHYVIILMNRHAEENVHHSTL